MMTGAKGARMYMTYSGVPTAIYMNLQADEDSSRCILYVDRIPHLQTGINQLDSWHDIFHAVVDVAVSASLCGC